MPACANSQSVGLKPILIALILGGIACLLPLKAEGTLSPTPAGLVDYANILQGTDSRSGFSHGNTLPLVGMPWGMVDWSMQNGVTGWFFHPNGKIDGFRATHEPSPWMGDWGQFVLMPQSGDLQMDAHDRTVDYDTTTAILHPD